MRARPRTDGGIVHAAVDAAAVRARRGDATPPARRHDAWHSQRAYRHPDPRPEQARRTSSMRVRMHDTVRRARARTPRCASRCRWLHARASVAVRTHARSRRGRALAVRALPRVCALHLRASVRASVRAHPCTLACSSGCVRVACACALRARATMCVLRCVHSRAVTRRPCADSARATGAQPVTASRPPSQHRAPSAAGGSTRLASDDACAPCGHAERRPRPPAAPCPAGRRGPRPPGPLLGVRRPPRPRGPTRHVRPRRHPPAATRRPAAGTRALAASTGGHKKSRAARSGRPGECSE